MKLVVVGGQARKVGKTSVIAGLIRGLTELAWTAVKISYHQGDNESQDSRRTAELAGDARMRNREAQFAPLQVTPTGGLTTDSAHGYFPAQLDFLLSEERDPQEWRDTSLYLAAGARRALWLRARGGGLARALPGLLAALARDEHVIVESNSLMGFVRPTLFLMVMGGSRQELKSSAWPFLERADAFVSVGPDGAARAWPQISLAAPQDRPVFFVSPGDWSSSDLCHFVSERLKITPKEQPWQH